MKKDRYGETVPEDIKQVERLRTRLGMVFQQFNLFPHLTVLQNLTLGPTKALGLSQKDANEKHVAKGKTHLLYYRNIINYGYRQDENTLKEIIKENIKTKEKDDVIKLIIYYKTLIFCYSKYSITPLF